LGHFCTRVLKRIDPKAENGERNRLEVICILVGGRKYPRIILEQHDEKIVGRGTPLNSPPKKKPHIAFNAGKKCGFIGIHTLEGKSTVQFRRR